VPLDLPLDDQWIESIDLALADIERDERYFVRPRCAEREFQMSISLAHHGQLENVVCFLRDRRAVVVAGVTRVGGAELLRWPTIRAKMKKGPLTAEELVRYAGLTNITRTAMSAYDTMMVVLAHAENRKVSVAQACRELGVQPSAVSNARWLTDPKTDAAIIAAVRSKILTGQAVTLLGKIKDRDARKTTAEELISGKKTVADLKKGDGK